MRRVIVCGSREWYPEHLPALRRRIANWLTGLPVDTVVVHGAARGVDRIAEQEAQKLGLIVEPYPYQQFVSEIVGPKRAPLVRNTYMASLGADLCVAFWNGKSTGTDHMLGEATKAGIPTERILA